jgi:hypothetical protein
VGPPYPLNRLPTQSFHQVKATDATRFVGSYAGTSRKGRAFPLFPLNPILVNSSSSLVGFLGIAVLLGVSQPKASAARASDLAPVQTRNAVVKLAQKLSVARAASTLPADLTNPFNPPEFDSPANPAGRTSARPEETATAPEVAPPSDREVLEALARLFPVGGAMERDDKWILTAGARQFQAGQVLTLTHGGRDYEVELVSIEARSFTLRYRNERITRSLYDSP